MFGSMSLPARVGYMMVYGGLIAILVTGSNALLRNGSVALFALNLGLLALGVLLLARDDYIRSLGWSGYWSQKWTSWRSRVGSGLISGGFFELVVSSITGMPTGPAAQTWSILLALGVAASVSGIALILTERGPKQVS
jgi:hypothetical protein